MKGQRRTSSRFPVHFSSSPRSIAIVDEDSSMQEALRKSLALKPQLLLFETYPDYPVCFNVFKRSPPDMVLLANSIGGIAGLHWLRKLNRAMPEVPIVLLAQSATPETVLEAILAGARGFLVKPVSPRKLLRAIARCLEGWPIFDRQKGTLLLRPRSPRAAPPSAMPPGRSSIMRSF